MFDPSVLKRDPAAINKLLVRKPGSPVYAAKPLTIHFPVRFTEVGLAEVGIESFIYGLMAIISEDNNYCVLNANAYINLGKADISVTEVGDTQYYQFKYDKGEEIIKTTSVVKRSKLIYNAISEFIFKGKIPYYVNYDDLGRIFDTAKKYTGTKAVISPQIVEFMAAYITRKKADRTKFAREGASSLKDFSSDKLTVVPMSSVFWSAPGTVNKIAGAYFEDGVTTAILQPSDKTHTVEKILRA